MTWATARWSAGAAPPLTPVSAFSAKTRGCACASLKRPCPRPPCRCCCAARTCSATATTPMMWW
ncbi:hypothetical protein B1M74_18495, partial [Salmonella enterica subsp. enterica serovar Dublin]